MLNYHFGGSPLLHGLALIRDEKVTNANVAVLVELR